MFDSILVWMDLLLLWGGYLIFIKRRDFSGEGFRLGEKIIILTICLIYAAIFIVRVLK